MTYKVVVDTLGSDKGPEAIIDGCIKALTSFDELFIANVIDKESFNRFDVDNKLVDAGDRLGNYKNGVAAQLQLDGLEYVWEELSFGGEDFIESIIDEDDDYKLSMNGKTFTYSVKIDEIDEYSQAHVKGEEVNQLIFLNNGISIVEYYNVTSTYETTDESKGKCTGKEIEKSYSKITYQFKNVKLKAPNKDKYKVVK